MIKLEYSKKLVKSVMRFVREGIPKDILSYFNFH